MMSRKCWILPACAWLSATYSASGQEVAAAPIPGDHWWHQPSYVLLVPTNPVSPISAPAATYAPQPGPPAAPAQAMVYRLQFATASSQSPTPFPAQLASQPQYQPPPPYQPTYQPMLPPPFPQAPVTLEQLERQAREQKQASIEATKAVIDRMSVEADGLRGRLAQLESETTRARALLKELEGATPRDPAPPAPAPTASLTLPPKPDASRLSDQGRAALAKALGVVNEHHSTTNLKPEQRRAYLTALASQFYTQSVGTQGEALTPDESRDIQNLIDLLMQPQPGQAPPAPPSPAAPPVPSKA